MAFKKFVRSIETLMCIGAALAALPAHARTLDEFYRGARATAMGTAFTAVSDDSDAVFYNPAGLAHNNNIEVTLANPKIEASHDDMLVVTDLRSSATKFDGATLNKLFGRHIHGAVNVFPNIKLPGFILGYYYSASGSVISRNPSYPSIEAEYIRDQGVVTGFGNEMKLGKRHYLRLGTTVKWINRTGFRRVLPLTQLAAGDKSVFSGLVGGPYSGWGVGLGLQYELVLGRSTDFVFGTAWQDIGDTSFGNDLAGNRPPAIRNNLAVGGALVHRLSGGLYSSTNVKVSGEVRHLLEPNTDPRLKMHFGAELDLGILSVQAGLNQDSLTFGVGAQLLGFKVRAVTYGVQQQSLAFMDRERRYMAEISWTFGLGGIKGSGARDEDRKKHPRTY